MRAVAADNRRRPGFRTGARAGCSRYRCRDRENASFARPGSPGAGQVRRAASVSGRGSKRVGGEGEAQPPEFAISQNAPDRLPRRPPRDPGPESRRRNGIDRRLRIAGEGRGIASGGFMKQDARNRAPGSSIPGTESAARAARSACAIPVPGAMAIIARPRPEAQPDARRSARRGFRRVPHRRGFRAACRA